MYQNHTYLSHEDVSPDEKMVQLHLKNWEGNEEYPVFTLSQLKEFAGPANRDPSEARWFRRIVAKIDPDYAREQWGDRIVNQENPSAAAAESTEEVEEAAEEAEEAAESAEAEAQRAEQEAEGE